MTSRLLSSAFVLASVLSASPLVAQDTNTPAAPAAPATPAAPAPAPAPAPAAAPVMTDTSTPSTPEERPSTYTIVQGDSLWVIAHKFGTSIHALRKANHLKKHALLHPGQVLQIPPATADTATK